MCGWARKEKNLIIIMSTLDDDVSGQKKEKEKEKFFGTFIRPEKKTNIK